MKTLTPDGATLRVIRTPHYVHITVDRWRAEPRNATPWQEEQVCELSLRAASRCFANGRRKPMAPSRTRDYWSLTAPRGDEAVVVAALFAIEADDPAALDGYDGDPEW